MPNFAKPEADRPKHDLRAVHVAPIVDTLVAAVQPQLVAKGLAYRVAVPPELTVEADAQALQQVLLTLISNAIKFTDRGGRITVDVATRETGDDGGKPGVAFLRVSDTGIGISRHHQESIFDAAVQARRRLASGNDERGRGLPHSLELAHRMGGDLRVRSVEGEGSVFTLSLRMAQDERAER